MLLLLGLALGATNECAQYSGSCQSCLNISAGGTEGGRQNCGWCHFPIHYQSGGEGARCADIRDLPWKCTDLYDTYKCLAGYTCDFTLGQCKIAHDGEGYSKEACEQFCKVTDSYKCNLKNYQCEQCAPGEINCFPKDMACKNCQAPPEAQYKCDKTDPKNPQCNRCKDGDKDCAPASQACSNCTIPPKQFTCDVKTHKCVPAAHGIIGPVCNSTCGNVTPPELQDRVFRGVQAHKDFSTDATVGQGEFDFVFKGHTLTIRNPAGKTSTGNVVSEGPGAIAVDMSGTTLRFSVAGSNQGDETTTVVLATAGPNQPQTDAKAAMALPGTNHPAVFVLSQCVPWKQKCDFSSVEADEVSLLALFGVDDDEEDACNQYDTCHTCIQGSAANLKCGWCMGGTLNYKTRGQTSFHCGGYKEGTPSKFVCEPLFQTVDCAGWGCNWNNATCSKRDPGEWADEKTCEETCKPTTMAKCDLVSKQCKPCKQGDAGCIQTSEQCDQSCDVPRAKCNVTTKQCTTCDPLHDPSCLDTKGACDDKCKNSPDYNICNTATGKCESCDPSTQKGCNPGAKDQCDAACANQTGFVKCNWSTNQCEPTSPTDPDRKTKAECEKDCTAAFAKCNPKTNTCDACDPGNDKDCLQTKAWCAAYVAAGKCKANPHELVGVWRGNAIEKGFKRGEYDVEFNADATEVTLSFFDTSAEKKWHAAVAVSAATAEEAGVQLLDLTFDQAPPSNELGVAAGQKVTALFQEKDDYTGLFKILYFAIPKAGAATPPSFDAAMDDSTEFVLVGCKATGACDFSKAAPAIEAAVQSIFI
jgi:hypothetical protein